MPAHAPIVAGVANSNLPNVASTSRAPLSAHPFALSNSLIELLPNDEDDAYSDDDEFGPTVKVPLAIWKDVLRTVDSGFSISSSY